MKLTFPHLGNAYLAIEPLLEGIGHVPITPPLGSKCALIKGSNLSPSEICLPFKIILGNMLEGLEQGADGVVMIGGCGPCRLGYYGETQRILLAEHGQRTHFFTLEMPRVGYGKLGAALIRTCTTIKPRQVWSKGKLAWAKLIALEDLEAQALYSRPREKKPGLTSAVLNRHLTGLHKAQSLKTIRQEVLDGRLDFEAIIDQKRTHPIPKVGIVGEIYTVLEPLANLDLEVRLGHLGVEVVRTIGLSEWVKDHVLKKAVGFSHLAKLEQSARDYLRGFVGGHGLESVARSVDLAREKLDGIIHILPLSCTPELVAQGILPRVSADYAIPILSLVVDEHAAETGFQTRLEAFADLIERRMYGQWLTSAEMST